MRVVSASVIMGIRWIDAEPVRPQPTDQYHHSTYMLDDDGRVMPVGPPSDIADLYADERLPVAEEIVSLAKDPLYRAKFQLSDDDFERAERGIEHREKVSTILRTGGLFVFSKDDIPPIDGSADDDIRSRTELPPLPYPRMWLEIDAKPEETRFRDLDGRMSFFFGWAIVEEKPLEHWEIFMPMVDQEYLRDNLDAAMKAGGIPIEALTTRSLSIMLDPETGHMGLGIGGPEFETVNEVLSEFELNVFIAMNYLPEYLVQLLHVLGVRTPEIYIPRAQRRDFQRRFGYDHPTLYRVDLRSAGDEHEEGVSDIVYRHRWLVRGHYRAQSNGPHFVSHKGACTWVRPYIKGPAGAPWKGRPVYMTGEAA